MKCSSKVKFLCEKCETELKKLEVYKVFDKNTWSGNKLEIDKVIVCFSYKEKGLLYKLFYYFKYGGVAEIAEVFGGYLRRALEEVFDSRGCIIVPAPIGPKRFKQRVFNQAKLLADVLGEQSGLMVLDCLKRKDANKQSLLSPQERVSNLKGKFSLNSKFCERLVGRRVILIDDVITTASTMNEAARVLKLAGVKEIIGLAVAKNFK